MSWKIFIFILKFIAAVPVLFYTDKLIEATPKNFKKARAKFVLAVLFIVGVCVAEMILIPI